MRKPAPATTVGWTIQPLEAGEWARHRNDLMRLEYTAVPENFAESEETLARIAHIEGGFILLAEAGGEIIGYAAAAPLEQIKGSPAALADPAWGRGDTCYILAITVAIDWRQRGLGTALARSCHEFATRAGFARTVGCVESSGVARLPLRLLRLATYTDWCSTGRSFDYVAIIN